MATYVLIPGAGSDPWYWHLVAPRLAALGHDVVNPDLPIGGAGVTFSDYADAVVDDLHHEGVRCGIERRSRVGQNPVPPLNLELLALFIDDANLPLDFSGRLRPQRNCGIPTSWRQMMPTKRMASTSS